MYKYNIKERPIKAMRERDNNTKCYANIGNMHLKTRHKQFTYGLGFTEGGNKPEEQHFNEQKPKFLPDKRVMIYSRWKVSANIFGKQMSIYTNCATGLFSLASHLRNTKTEVNISTIRVHQKKQQNIIFNILNSIYSPILAEF